MFDTARRLLVGGLVAFAGGAAATVGLGAQAPGVKITDPTSVVMIVNRDSNDIGFMDIKTEKMIDRKSTRLNSSHLKLSRMPSSA